MSAVGTLEALRLHGRRSRIYVSSEVVLLLVSIAVGLVIVRLNLENEPNKGWLDALAAVSGLVAAFGAYKQWRAGRQESSFDKYYERLDSANEKFSAYREKLLESNAAALVDHLKTMHVFAELDNLEYILEKYKLAYVKQDLVERAICAFRSRCQSDADFTARALTWVGNEEKGQVAGYQLTTRDAVFYIANHLKS